jgi:hypothetical protein
MNTIAPVATETNQPSSSRAQVVTTSQLRKRIDSDGTESLSGSEESLTATATTASTSIISDVQPTVINAPAQIGLIMPNPGSGKVYTGQLTFSWTVVRYCSILIVTQQVSNTGWDF